MTLWYNIIMKTKELLRQPQEVVINLTRGIQNAIETRRYGRLEHRQSAYDLLRKRFNQVFIDHPDYVGTLRDDPDTRRMVFGWSGIGTGSLDEKDGTYRFHVISNRYGQKETIWGDRVKEKHTELVLSLDGAVITDYEQNRTTPPPQYSEFRFPMVSESKHKEAILDIETALNLVEGLGMEQFRPTIDSWFADYPKGQQS